MECTRRLCVSSYDLFQKEILLSVIVAWSKCELCSLCPHIRLRCFFLAGDSGPVPKLLWGEALESPLGSPRGCFSELSWAPIWPAEFCVEYSVVSLLPLPSKALCSLPSPSSGGKWLSPRSPQERWKFPRHSAVLSSTVELALKAKHPLAHLHLTLGTKLGLGY